MNKKKNIKDYGPKELKGLAEDLDYKKFRGAQIFDEIFSNRQNSFSDSTSLPKELRAELDEKFIINSLELQSKSESEDGTIKFLFGLKDGGAIESVLIPTPSDKGERLTLCVSSQVGCPFNCVFCATGKMGFKRNLTAAEIIDQIFITEREIGDSIDNIVFMGMGEPMLNFEVLEKSLKIIADAEIIGSKKIVVSTVGVPDGILKLAEIKPSVKLAISLHATTDKTRQSLIPYAKKAPLSEVLDAAEDYYKATKEAVAYEYLFLKGINNSDEDARRLAKITRRFPSKVNIIPYHDVSFAGDTGEVELMEASRGEINRFRELLKDLGVNCFVRSSSGKDIKAACGQLAYLKEYDFVDKNE